MKKGERVKMKEVIGRFAPSPSGRLHLGNVLCGMLSWLSAKSQGGKVLLRIEDLDTARCGNKDRIFQLIDDLHWLGFTFDGGEDPKTFQSVRSDVYTHYFERLREQDLVYPCYCTRAELHAASAPHESDGFSVYNGSCRRYLEQGETPPKNRAPAFRVKVPAREITVKDNLQGEFTQRLDTDCGDFLLRRSDGIYAYQLAVVVDDALSGVTEVVRGRDLLSSTPRQLYLYNLFGFQAPAFYHIPLLLRADGTRLAKRDGVMDMETLRQKFSSPEPIIGMLAYNAGLIPAFTLLTLQQLLPFFDWEKVKKEDIFLENCGLF